MIGEVASGSSFRGLNHYLLHGSARTEPRVPAWVELRNLAGSAPSTAHEEMHEVARENSRARDPVLHLIVSPAPEDQLSREQWSRLADRVLSDLGLAEHQALIVLHTDTDVPHLHMSVNRIHPLTHKAWETWRSKTRLTSILVAVEKEWGLRKVEGRLSPSEPTSLEGPRPKTRGERAQTRHRATPPQVAEWRRTLTPHFRDATSWTDLAARLQGVTGVHQLRAQGRGLLVTDGETYVKASSIDRAFSRGRLEERFGQTFAEWRKTLNTFDAASASFSKHATTAPYHPRAQAARRALEATGRSLGWRALSRLRGPLPPSVVTIPLAARRRARQFDREGAMSWNLLVRQTLAPALGRSRSWAEADSRLRLYGAWLAPEPNGRRLVITDGSNATPIRSLGPGVGDGELTIRLGSWRTWQRTRHHIVSRAHRLQRVEDALDRHRRRWIRLTRLIQKHELRLERYGGLRADYDATEARLRRLLRDRLSPRQQPRDLDQLLARLRAAPEQSVSSLVPPPRRRGIGRLRRESPSSPQLRRTIEDYRRLTSQLTRTAAPARGAYRRLERLRRQARALNPTLARQRAQHALAAAVRTAGRTGLASLVAHAAPGLGTALTVVRLATRAVRGLAREDQSR